MPDMKFSKEDYERLKKLLKEKSLLIPHIDVAGKEGDETVFGFKVNKERKEWGNVRTAHVYTDWESDRFSIVLVCPICKEPLKLHNGNKCPVIIDAEFKDDEPPLLTSGETQGE